MNKLVTVGIPVYKRLNFLPQALRSVAAQDYPAIELIVSDNGQNGAKIPEIVDQYYGRPYRFRQNATTVECSAHYNQLLNEASGDYAVFLGDDDEISSNLVSDLVRLLEKYPDAPVAIPKQELMDEGGITFKSSSNDVPEILSGEEFIRGWCLYTYRFETFSTVLLRTAEARRYGGYPIMPSANGDENLLMIKLCLGKSIALSGNSTVRKRHYETSLGLACDYQNLVDATKLFMKLVDEDPIIQQFARRHPDRWAESRELLAKMSWGTCFYRWKDMYRDRLPTLKWMASAFRMPYIQAYYAAVIPVIMENAKFILFSRAKELCPWAFKLYRALKYKSS